MKHTPRYYRAWRRPLISAVLIPLQLLYITPIQVVMAQAAQSTSGQATSSPKPEDPKITVKHGSRVRTDFKPSLQLSDNPSDADIRMARVFPTPLIPMSGKGVAGENQALASALQQFYTRDNNEDTSSISSFLDQYPTSRWRAAVQHDLGELHFETGYLSKALAEWRDSWDLAKNEKGVEQHALADSSFGHLAFLSAELGRVTDLKSLFAETQKRGFYGAAAQLVHGAQSGYRKMLNHPDIAFKCGPFALDSVRTADSNVHPRSPTVQGAASTANGTSLSMVNAWAGKLGLKYQMAKRTEGSAFVVPSVMHWKLGHFAALVREKSGKYLIQDPTFAGQELWVSAKALEAETSGYFLVPQGKLAKGWQSVSNKEANAVWGRGGATGTDLKANTPNDQKCPCSPPGAGGKSPMTSASVFSMLASLCLQDTPVRYQVPVGPNPDLTVTYSYSISAPPVPFTTTFGYNWSFEYISYLTVDASHNVTVTLPESGTEVANYSAYDDVNNVYPVDPKSMAQIYVDSPGIYDRHLPNGSRQVYSLFDGAGHYFLTQIYDPQGNSLVLNYDSHYRLTSIVDQLSQSTTLSYLSATPGTAGFYQVSRVTEPFGRYATFGYDATSTKLMQLTDVLGLTSQYTYDSNYFVDSLTTPYGKTYFYNYVPTSDADGESGLKITWPDGSVSITENYIGHELNTYYWDRRQSPSYPDKGSAQVYHWELEASGNLESGVMNYSHQPLESPSDTWPSSATVPAGAVAYNYPNGYSVAPPTSPPPPPEDNFTHDYVGSLDLPSQVYRTLDNGDTQTSTYGYNAIGNITSYVDPLGRTYSLFYDGNNIDLLQVRQTKGGSNDLLSKCTYNSQHESLTFEDGSGQITTYTYNAAGQIHTVAQPSPGGTTTFNYTSSYLTSIDGPLTGSNDVTSLTYDSYGRVHTVSDSEGYTLTFSYDAYDRPTAVAFPDGTYEQVDWNNLDPVFLRDRIGNWTQQQFDSLRQLVGVTDPNGHTTKYSWCTCGGLASIIDPNGNVTSWQRDSQGRPTVKTYPDGKTTSYGYETSTSRLKTVTDALNQTKTYSYNDDDSLSGIAYSNAVNSTSSVSLTYDSSYPRLSTVGNGYGTYSYSYNSYITDPYGTATTGAGQVSQITNSGLSNSTMAYSYDALGQVTNRTINGSANSASWSYDAMSRVTSISNILGTFTPSYVDQSASGGDKGTTRLASFTYPNGQVTDYSYYSTTNDERLQEIKNLTPTSAVQSQFDYTYDSNGQILSWQRTLGSNPATTYNFTYDAAGRLSSGVLSSSGVVLHQYYYNFDPMGNRTGFQADSNVTHVTPNNLNQISSIAAGGRTRFQGTISQPGTVSVNGSAAFQSTSTNFVANPSLSGGTNSVAVVATNGNGAAQTNNYQVVIPPTSTMAPSYDSDGNMTNNGSGQTYAWDAENQLLSITYTGGATTNFTYDAFGRCVKLVESTGLTKQFIWSGASMAEQRDGSNIVTARFFPEGEQISGTAYNYAKDHLGSVRELTDSGGNVQAQYDYDPYGNASLIQGSNLADFQYAGMYDHQISGLNLTLFRAYNPIAGEWLSRDPIGEGTNLYTYVANDPINLVDVFGLKPGDPFPTAAAAAKDALSYINPKSIKDNHEYGGMIYKSRKDGKYYATPPVKGNQDSVVTTDSSSPEGKCSEVGDYHTHGNYSKGVPAWPWPWLNSLLGDPHIPVATGDPHQDDYDSDNFSEQDKIDAYSESLLRPPSLTGEPFNSYLGTPSGNFQQYTPTTGPLTGITAPLK